MGIPSPKTERNLLTVTAERTSSGDWSDLRAEALADLLGDAIMDAEDAAAFLEIEKNSVDYAMFRGRLPYVQYGSRRLIARGDLEEYKRKRGRGRDSQLIDATAYARDHVKG